MMMDDGPSILGQRAEEEDEWRQSSMATNMMLVPLPRRAFDKCGCQGGVTRASDGLLSNPLKLDLATLLGHRKQCVTRIFTEVVRSTITVSRNN